MVGVWHYRQVAGVGSSNFVRNMVKKEMMALDNGYYEIMEGMRIILVRLSYTTYLSDKVADMLCRTRSGRSTAKITGK